MDFGPARRREGCWGPFLARAGPVVMVAVTEAAMAAEVGVGDKEDGDGGLGRTEDPMLTTQVTGAAHRTKGRTGGQAGATEEKSRRRGERRDTAGRRRVEILGGEGRLLRGERV